MIDKFLNYIFLIIAYGLNKDQLYDLPLQIVNKNNNLIPIYKKNNKNKIIIYIHILCIFSILLWRIIYSIYKNINNNFDIRLCSYSFLIISQYIIGLLYFNKKHYYIKIKNKNLKNIFHRYLIYGTIIGIILTFTTIFLLLSDYPVFIYSDIYKDTNNNLNKVLICFLMLIEFFISNQIFIVNTSVFISNILQHRDEISQFISLIFKNIKSSVTKNGKINSIAIEYGKIRDNYNETVNKTQYFLTILNIFGFIHLINVLKLVNNNELYFIDIISCIIFLITDLIYIYVLQLIQNSIDLILEIITSELFIVSFFQITKKYNNNIKKIKNKEKILDNTQNIIYLNNICINIENNINNLEQNIDWISLQIILKNPWKKYVIFGIELNNTNIIQKIFGSIIIILIAKDSNQIFGFF